MIIGSHTGDNLLAEYEHVTTTFNIQTKVIRLITDNASNNLSAFSQLILPGFELYFEQEDGDDSEEDEYEATRVSPIEDEDEEDDPIDSSNGTEEFVRLPCFIHTIQLVVQDGLREGACIRSTMAKVAAIAKLSHKSTLIAEQLHEINVSIPTPVATRWNSQYLTASRILDVPNATLTRLLTEQKHCELILSVKDISILREFLSIFALFAEATIQTQTGSNVSISMVAPSVLGIYFDLENEAKVCKYTGSLCTSLLKSLKQRFGGLLLNLDIPVSSSLKHRNTFSLFSDEIFLISTFVDAQFKLRWITQSELEDAIK